MSSRINGHSLDKSQPSPRGVTHEDLIQTAKAITHTIRQEIQSKDAEVVLKAAGVVSKHLDDQVKDAATKVLTAYAKDFEARLIALEKSFTERDAAMQRQFEARAIKMQEDYAQSKREFDAHAKALSAVCEKSLDACRSLETQQKSLASTYEQKADLLQESVKQIGQWLDKLTKMPTPIVHNHIPATLPAEVKVDVHPEVKAPDVKVDNVVPPAPPRVKFFQYDEHGRPLRVWEEEVKHEQPKI